MESSPCLLFPDGLYAVPSPPTRRRAERAEGPSEPLTAQRQASRRARKQNFPLQWFRRSLTKNNFFFWASREADPLPSFLHEWKRPATRPHRPRAPGLPH
ncbi:hypothetical protein E2C01_071961 [Portunus trituberculatus]|uniref:Uncharacterized protein n=1 Tax=Portunus trituberculatus TaxID=210409 RepID=A0A5B7I6H8_PORTR|nr:hypothetical protein [Portunus trituberculatus]